jgi:hypothetical protein
MGSDTKLGFCNTGLGLWALWKEESFGALMYGLQIVPGIGIGTLFSIIVIPIQASLQLVDDFGLAAGIPVSFRLFGGLIGLSVFSTVFSNTLQHKIAALGPLPAVLELLLDVCEIIASVATLRFLELEPLMMRSIQEVCRESTMAVFLVVAGFGVV